MTYKYQAPEYLPAHEELKAAVMKWLVEDRGHKVICNDVNDVMDRFPELGDLAYHVDFVTENENGAHFWDVKGGYREDTGNVSLTDKAIQAYERLDINVWICTQDGRIASSRFVARNAVRRENGQRGFPFYLYKTALSPFTWGPVCPV